MVQPCSGTPSRTKFVARCSPTGRRPPLHPLFCPAGAAAVSVPLCAACRAGRGGGAGVGQLLDAPRCRGSVQQPAGACRGVGWWLGAQGRVVGMQDVCSETAQALHGAAACPSGVVSECVSLPLPSCRRVPPAALPPPPPPPPPPPTPQVSAFTTASHVRFLLLHDGRSDDLVKSFFRDMYELYLRVRGCRAGRQAATGRVRRLDASSGAGAGLITAAHPARKPPLPPPPRSCSTPSTLPPPRSRRPCSTIKSASWRGTTSGDRGQRQAAPERSRPAWCERTTRVGNHAALY